MRGIGSRVDIQTKHRKENDMKKLIMMLAAVAMAACAMANDSECWISTYSKDTAPSTANASWYSCYFLDLDAAKVATGGAVTTVNKDAYAAWLQANFANNKAATIAGAQLPVTANADTYYEMVVDQYVFLFSAPTLGDIKEFYAVCFFDNGSEQAFKVGTPEDNLFFLDDLGEYCTEWTAAPSTTNVPEPTSGLMLLLGLAGLALKRKAV